MIPRFHRRALLYRSGPLLSVAAIDAFAEDQVFKHPLYAVAGRAASLTRRRQTVLLLPFLAAQNPGYEHVGQALRFCLSDLVKMKAVPARTCTARELGLDLSEQTLNAKGAGLHGCLVLSRAAFVLSRATRSAISSMRASSCSSFCVSRHARIMPRPLQIRAPTWLSSEPSDMALIVLPRALMTCPKVASRPILNCLVFIGFCSPRA